MTIIQALLGEHGAMYPLLELIEKTAALADLEELKIRANCLQAILSSHARIEDALLRPFIQQYLPPPAPPTKGSVTQADHQVIDEGLARVLRSAEVQEARAALLDTVAKTRRHFLKEETLIFGIAARELPHQHQEQLGAEWARRRGVFVNGTPSPGVSNLNSGPASRTKPKHLATMVDSGLLEAGRFEP
jgi:hemerythrin-like domain-containing protein